MRARVQWKLREEGGRTSPPAGVGEPPYAPTVRLLSPAEPWPGPVTWSLVVEKISSANDGLEWLANVYYLVDKAPSHELYAGREFELYEGGRCVATGTIVDDR